MPKLTQTVEGASTNAPDRSQRSKARDASSSVPVVADGLVVSRSKRCIYTIRCVDLDWGKAMAFSGLFRLCLVEWTWLECHMMVLLRYGMAWVKHSALRGYAVHGMTILSDHPHVLSMHSASRVCVGAQGSMRATAKVSSRSA